MSSSLNRNEILYVSMPSLRHFLFMQFLLLGNNCWNNWNQETHPVCLAQDMKSCYLQKKNCVNIFKSLVAWGLLRLNFWNENLFTSPTLSYNITKKQAKIFLQRQNHWGSCSPWGSSLIVFSLGFTVISS